MYLKYPKLTIVFLMLGLFSFSQKKRKKTKPLNLIFISVDDMNNWIGKWKGIADTPNIDKLAEEGIAFKSAHCTAPSCNPSRASLLTGQRPETTGIYSNNGNFREKKGGKKRVTLPQFLRSKGYKAIAAGKLFHAPRGNGKEPNSKSDPKSWDYQLKTAVGTPRNDSYYDENRQAKWLKGETEFEGLEIDEYLRESGIWGPIQQTKEQCGDWQTAQFGVDFLKKNHDKPFFLALGIFRPHAPLIAPKEYFDKYPLEDIKLPNIPLDDMNDIPERARINFSSGFAKKVKSDTLQWKKAVQAYLACTSFADDCVGEILRGVESSKYKDNTVIVFWSDHGWQLGHKDRWEKQALWYQATHAPLIIRTPDQKHNKPISDHVSLLDIFPTVTDLLNLKTPKFVEGNSLFPLLEDPKAKWEHKAVVSQFRNYSVLWKDWNYIKYKHGEELYNLKEDPNEWHNLAGNPKNKEIINELRKAIPKIE